MVLFLKVFLTEFIAEMGDKTQLMLIALYFEVQAERHYPGNRSRDSGTEWNGGSRRRPRQRIHSGLAD